MDGIHFWGDEWNGKSVLEARSLFENGMIQAEIQRKRESDFQYSNREIANKLYLLFKKQKRTMISTVMISSYRDYVPENSKHSPSSGINTRPSLPCFFKKITESSTADSCMIDGIHVQDRLLSRLKNDAANRSGRLVR